jgi:tetratricopeptide (TPR) repeat protein
MSNSRFEKLVEMLEKQPDDLFLLYALAMEYLGMKEMEKAQHLFEQIIASDEHYVSAYYQLGLLLEGTHEQRAIEIYEKGMQEAQLKGDRKTVNEFRSALDELLY